MGNYRRWPSLCCAEELGEGSLRVVDGGSRGRRRCRDAELGALGEAAVVRATEARLADVDFGVGVSRLLRGHLSALASIGISKDRVAHDLGEHDAEHVVPFPPAEVFDNLDYAKTA